MVYQIFVEDMEKRFWTKEGIKKSGTKHEK
jgi:hypothetical protein